MSSARRTWRVQEFAERAGVTIKALRHYDRLGLLRPARTPAGHRRYSADEVSTFIRDASIAVFNRRAASA